MSYSFGMFFKQVNSLAEAFNLINQVSEELYKNRAQHLKDNRYSIPSNNLSKENHEADSYWLHSLFSNKFVWWEEEKLLGMSGYDFPFDVDNMFDCHICFQNGTDQDYPYSDWKDEIVAFKEEKEATLALSDDEIWKINDSEKEDYELENLSEATEYWRRSTMYDKVFERLDLGRYIYGENSEKFTRLLVCALNTSDKYVKTHALLRKFRGDFDK